MRPFQFREIKDEPKPFLDHIEDFRIMLFKMIVVLVVMMLLAFIFQNRIVSAVERPLLLVDPEMKSLVNFGVADPLTITVSLSFYAGMVLSFPFLVLFLAEFILPALTSKERRILYPVAASSFGLFMTGAAFSYYLILPHTLKYFFGYSESLHWRPQWSVREYFSFTTQLVIYFGLGFELPLVVLILVWLDILNYEILKRTRAYALVGILALDAVIVPADPLTLICMALPMYFLYEGCILIAWLIGRSKRRRADTEEAERIKRIGPLL